MLTTNKNENENSCYQCNHRLSCNFFDEMLDVLMRRGEIVRNNMPGDIFMVIKNNCDFYIELPKNIENKTCETEKNSGNKIVNTIK